MVWGGIGICVPFILLVCFLGALLGWQYLPAWAFLDILDTYSDEWAGASAGFFLAAIVCFLLGRYVNRPTGDLVIDPVTGREAIYRANHHFFFLGIEYWAVVSAVIGIGFWLP